MNKFDIKARVIENSFFRKLKNSSFFLTGNGKVNNIVGYSNKEIYIKSETGKKENAITRKQLKEAIAYLLYKRTATRKDLEKYTNFNSALMGLLRLILIEIAKIHKTVKGLLRITIKGVRFFFSGLDKPTIQDFNTIIQNGAMFILNSFYWLRERGNNLDEWIKTLEKNNIKLLVDSGAFSLFNAKKNGKIVVSEKAMELIKIMSPKSELHKYIKDITVEDYASFINRFKRVIYGFFNLDVIGDAAATERNFEQLKSLTGMTPIPVWHCDVNDWRKSNFELLDQIVEEDHEIIAIGATVMLGKNAGVKRQNEVKRELFDEIFKRHPLQNFHWLGGSSNILVEYPFFSADSSGWLQGRKKHQIYSFDSKEKATKLMPHWSKEKCLSYNVKSLSTLEDLYDGIQMDMENILLSV